MTMTKAEKAEMDALRTARDLARSLRWPEYAEPSPLTEAEIRASQTFEMKPRYGNSQFACRGFVARMDGMVNPRPIVREHFSNGIHNTNDASGQNWSQNMGRIYPSELDALRKLRLDLTTEYAASLAAVDAMIAERANA